MSILQKIAPFLVAILVLGGAGFFLYGENFFSHESKRKHALRIGVTVGPHLAVLEKVKELARKENLELAFTEFSDFIQPNAALERGELDLNCYQHRPFLDEQNKTRGYNLVAVAPTLLMPIAIYSQKISALKDLPKGAKIGIPNDPTNGSRALKLLEQEKLIKLKETLLPSALDIIDNPQDLHFVEIEAPNLPRSLPDLDAAVINFDWIVVAKMEDLKPLAQESKDSPFVNYIVARQSDEQKSEIQKLVQIYQRPEIKAFIENEFHGQVIAAW